MSGPGRHRSPQTLREADRRVVAVWAADCAERVLGVFEAEAPGDGRPRDAIARTRAFARGESTVAEEIRRRFVNGGARPVGCALPPWWPPPGRPEAVQEEVRWQLRHLSPAARAALRKLPPVGENASGPLGPGLLASGVLGSVIRDLQAGLANSEYTDTWQ